MRRLLLAPLALLGLLAGCGSGGDGSGVEERSLYWGIPFVPDSSDRSLILGARTLENEGATVTFQGYRPDGTPYTGPVLIDLDGQDEAHLSAGSALGGDAPAGGWILATTDSTSVEVFFELIDAPEEEASRAAQLPDLLMPPPSSTVGISAHTETERIQISNASGAPNAITVTPYEEPLGDPDLPPVALTPFVLMFAPFETKTFDPDGLSGESGFFGSFFLEAPGPFFAATEEAEIALDVQKPASFRFEKAPSRMTSDVALRWGREFTGLAENLWDFVLVARNDSDQAQTLTIDAIHDFDGGVILDVPRIVTLDPHEMRVEDTEGFLFGDLFGDVGLAPGLRNVHVKMTIPPQIWASWRQFDAGALAWAMTLPAIPQGHVFDVSNVQGTAPNLLDVMDIANPSDTEITVDVTVLIPEPDGFDATPLFLFTATLPPHVVHSFVVDGAFLNRDLEEVPFVGMRFTSLAPFTVTAHRERRSGGDLVIALSPRPTANHEVNGGY